MTTDQEKTLIEAVRYLLRERQIESRIESRRLAKEHGYSDMGTRERIRECESDADYCGELLGRL
jgi:hypothetical protein